MFETFVAMMAFTIILIGFMQSSFNGVTHRTNLCILRARKLNKKVK